MDDEMLSTVVDAHRNRLRSLAYRILGSNADADDAVQEVWIRLARADAAAIDHLPAWLTTVTTRVCLNVVRARTTRREDPFDQVTIETSSAAAADPGDVVWLAESVSAALTVLLDTLDPAERVAFVLHDLFAVPFPEIASMLGRTPAGTRQLASRARRRLRSGDLDGTVRRLGETRAVTDAFYDAARRGDLDGLVALLDPGTVLRVHDHTNAHGPAITVSGAAQVAGRALAFARPDAVLLPARVGDRAAMIASAGGVRLSLMAFTIIAGRISRIDALVDSSRLEQLDPVAL